MRPSSRVLVAASAALIGALSASVGVASAGPIPSAAVKAMRKVAGPSAFLPTSLPSGYRYAGWKNESPNGVPFPDNPWLVVTFAHGASRLLWTVMVLSPGADEDRCNALSAGHTLISGKAIYWSSLTTYDPLGSGPKGRHVWQCLNSPGGGDRLKLDAFDQGAGVAITILGGMVARSSGT